jgi:carboxypeptidase C (cathepsin A)
VKHKIAVVLMILAGWSGVVLAQEKPAEKPAEKAAEKPAADAPKKEPPKPEQSVTQHSVAIGGVPVSYTATAGTLIVRNEKDEPWASMGYVAYVKKDGNTSRRPITFAFNGGPGSSSVWLHMGALGPRRVVTADAAPTPPPPYQVVDNAWSVLDRTDLVMIDPVGTGLSKAVGEGKDKDFWGADPDIESVSRFIRQYVSDNGRWNSPKYLLGESYGTTRSGGIVDWLQNRGMAFNGVVLVSVALDLSAIFAYPGNDRPYPSFLPSFAAVSAYHKLLPSAPQDLDAFLAEVRQYATGEYASALLAGDSLPAARRVAVVKKLHEYTGLSEDYLDKANLRVDEGKFTQELLRQKGVTIGRLDARFLGPTLDVLSKQADYDPQSAAISSAYTAAFLAYYNDDLKFGQGKTYQVTNYDIARSWDFKHKVAGGEFPLPMVNTIPDLAHAMTVNPRLRVLVQNGTFDLATPFFATEMMMNALGLEKSLRPHVELKYYPAGHMMYIYAPALKAFKADIADFIDRTSKPSP